MEDTSPQLEIKDNNNTQHGDHLNMDFKYEYDCVRSSSCEDDDDNENSHGSFGEVPHPKFDSSSVLDKLRDVDVGQELLDVVQGTKRPRDNVVDEIMSKARRTLLEREFLTEDVLEPVDKVYTIGCFDVFHPGHELLLKRMRAYGKKVCVGVHDCNSIYQLKGIWPEDNTAKRMLNVKEYADVVFCVAGTDPTPFIVSAIDLQRGETAIYIRGNDMENFPSKDIVSAIMPIKLLPYSDGISSSQLRRSISRSRSEKEACPDEDNEDEGSLDSSGRGTEPSDETGDRSISANSSGYVDETRDGGDGVDLREGDDVFEQEVKE